MGIVTVTTVGYGDQYPVTPFGQGVAVALMLVGIGLIGVLTATVASSFITRRRTGWRRLERMEALLGGIGRSGRRQQRRVANPDWRPRPSNSAISGSDRITNGSREIAIVRLFD